MYEHAQITTQQYNGTSAGWERLLQLFSEQELNQIPFEGSWSLGQLADNVYKATKAYLHLIAGPGKATEIPCKAN